MAQMFTIGREYAAMIRERNKRLYNLNKNNNIFSI